MRTAEAGKARPAASELAEPRKHSWMRHRLLPAVIISILYLVSRYANLGRELTFEEGFFLAPGVELFHHGHYQLYWGELDPSLDPFHKPPLCSLLLGLFSLVSFDPVAGARLAPFLIGWLVCLAPLLLTESWWPSVLVLLSPFLYGASSQMQTDPTGVLLGYTLVTAALVPWNSGPPKWLRGAFLAGIVILWLTRIESGAMATAAIVLVLLLPGSGDKRKLAKDLAIATAAGLGLLVILSSALALSDGISPAAALASIFGTVTRIVGGTVGRHITVEGAGSSSRKALFDFAAQFRFWDLLLLCWIPACIALALKRRDGAFRDTLWKLLALFLVPLAATFSVAYVGDGFPRYLLIAIPPSLAMLGFALSRLDARTGLWMGVAVGVAGVALMAPATMRAAASPGSPSAFRGEHGTWAAAEIAKRFTRAGDLILAPEGEIFYLQGRRVMNIDAFDPYPARHPLAARYTEEVKAAVIRRAAPASAAVDEFLDSLQARGATRIDADSYFVYVLAGGPRLEECAPGADAAIVSAEADRTDAGTVQWRVTGRCWDAAAPSVKFTGPQCEQGCVLPGGAISRKTRFALEGVADLPAGNYNIQVSGSDKRWSKPAPVAIPPAAK